MQTQALSQTSPNINPTIHPSLVMTPQEMAGKPDQAKPELLNEEIWKAIRGQNSKMPAPQYNLYANVPGADD
ncbi:hypothetical protein ACH4VM_35690 [Streptomyces sp. NPDC020792]|uniref:hypothetical protein n=1 Tax=Streptomyces sp. NPDC020792 TaxID=3365089 RepID=UPI0037A2E721